MPAIRYYAQTLKFGGVSYFVEFSDTTLRVTQHSGTLQGLALLLEEMRTLSRQRANGNFTKEDNGSENGVYRPLTENEMREAGII